MRGFVILSRAIIVASLFIAVMPASSQPAERQAEDLYDKGRALVAAGKTAEACAAFEQSQRIAPAVTTLIALGTCRERLGQLATAWKLFVEAERESRSASDDTIVQLHAIALDRAAKLEPRVPKLTIDVPVASKIDGLQILRDKDNLSEGDWNRALPIDGGTYTIIARAPGADEWSTSVTLASEGDVKTIDVPKLQTVKSSMKERPHVPAPDQPVTIRPRRLTLAQTPPDLAAASALDPVGTSPAAGSKKRTKLGADAAFVSPVWGYADFADAAFGLLGRFEYAFNPQLSVTGRLGYLYNLVDQPAGGFGLSMIPIFVGARFNFTSGGTPFVAGEIGVNNLRFSGFIGDDLWEPSLNVGGGFHFNQFSCRGSLFLPWLQHGSMIGIMLNVGYDFTL